MVCMFGAPRCCLGFLSVRTWTLLQHWPKQLYKKSSICTLWQNEALSGAEKSPWHFSLLTLNNINNLMTESFQRRIDVWTLRSGSARLKRRIPAAVTPESYFISCNFSELLDIGIKPRRDANRQRCMCVWWGQQELIPKTVRTMFHQKLTPTGHYKVTGL